MLFQIDFVLSIFIAQDLCRILFSSANFRQPTRIGLRLAKIRVNSQTIFEFCVSPIAISLHKPRLQNRLQHIKGTRESHYVLSWHATTKIGLLFVVLIRIEIFRWINDFPSQISMKSLLNYETSDSGMDGVSVTVPQKK